ncbi:unnamed protein product [Adineta steineri]|uniref:C2H2-type domain-containing protein n=1 Tax=Adineta steineri TaxID=433720 RepID=A0A820AZA6_9BILA|nr:unnamed protein product [Adineta steineri]CAF4193009.1 unnamed protein product [Adineta steineri]
MLVITPELREVGFTCYCDVGSISQANQLSLAHANVRITHVPGRKAGSVDRQILLDLDRFERAYPSPATIVLISGDIDFVGKLADLRHQAHFEVIVIHNKPAKQELKATVNKHYSWDIFTFPMQPSPMNDAFATCQVSSTPGAPPSNPISYHDYGNVYSTRDRYSPSYSSVPAQNVLQCPQCTSEFETENSLQQHQIAKQHLFDCSLCDDSFFTHAALFQHQKNNRHSQREVHLCVDCNRSFRTPTSLEQHENATGHGAELSSSSSEAERSDTKSTEFYCSKCNIEFKSAGFYVAHMLVHVFD